MTSADPHHADPLRDGTTPSADPDPADTVGLEPGTGVQPGDTPPAETAVSGLSYDQDVKAPNAGAWMIWLIVGVVVLLVAVGAVLGAVYGV